MYFSKGTQIVEYEVERTLKLYDITVIKKGLCDVGKLL